MISRATSLKASCLLAALALGAPAVCGSAESRQASIETSFALTGPTITLHEPLFIEFSIHNPLGQGVHADLGIDRKANFLFSVTRPDGSIVPLPRLKLGGFRRSGNITVAANETYRQSLLVNEWYEFPAPGKYLLRVRFLGSTQVPSGPLTISDLSDEFLIVVGPRDPNRLKEVCARLANAGTSPDLSVAADAVSALSLVQDLIAVPYLGRMARANESVEPAALKGLARIARLRGLHAVLSNLDPQDANLKPLISSSLREIEANVENAD